MSIRMRTQNVIAFSLLLFPLVAPMAHAQDPTSAQVTNRPPARGTPALPTALLISRCATPPPPFVADTLPPDPGAGVTMHLPMPALPGAWCVRALTAQELEIAEACVGALQPSAAAQP